MPLEQFHPLVASWFQRRFGQPTEPQRRGWPLIAGGQHTLIAAPTGSGKTLAAFLACIDRLVRMALSGELQDRVEVLYISPLKALSSDVRRNLEQPLAELAAEALAMGFLLPPIRVGLRTGDTPASERQAMVKRPPHILVTTPESLYLCLTSRRARPGLSAVRTVIVDEIHALVRDKRGSHMAISLERLDALCAAAGHPPPARVGLSATQRPIDEVARFLVGAPRVAEDGTPRCHILDGGHLRQLDLEVLLPRDELGAVCSSAQWDDVHDQIAALIEAHKTTLVFVSTRRLCERTAHGLAARLGEEAVVAHHGSMSRRLRHSVEERLKHGLLKAVVATASLELGIDIGAVDLVCQIGSPRAIATLLQRVGRANHRPDPPVPPPGGVTAGSEGGAAPPDRGQTPPRPGSDPPPTGVRPPPPGDVPLLPPKGRLFALTRDELVECAALLRAVRRAEFDRLYMPKEPLDVLSQQLCALCSIEEWDEEEAFQLFRRAWPFRDLKRERFDEVLAVLSEGVATRRGRRGAHLHRDVIGGRLRGRRGAHLFALINGGTIPEPNDYEVVAEPSGNKVGRLDEEWVAESSPGDIFLLGTTSWRIRGVRGSQVFVEDAGGAPPSVPFWAGEAPGRTFELSEAVSALRGEVQAELARLVPTGTAADLPELAPLVALLREACGPAALSEAAARTIAGYLGAAWATLGRLPTHDALVAERFFDEGGGMQLCLHMPFGARINRAFGLSLRKKFCRSFNFELQAAATDDGVLLSLGETHSFPLETVWQFLRTTTIEHTLKQALLGAPLFQPHFRWTALRALALARRKNGQKVPPQIVRMQTEDLLAAVFPEQAACPENLPGGDVDIPDHPLVRETIRECTEDVMDLPGLKRLLAAIEGGATRVFGIDTPEPSLLSHQLLNAAPYAFLDDVPLEERRARAVSLRRGLPASIVPGSGGALDPRAIAAVRKEAWPLVRDADELHDALLTLQLVPEELVPPDWEGAGFEALCAARRACVVRCGPLSAWVATERADLVRALLGGAGELTVEPAVPHLPWARAAEEGAAELAAVEVVRGWTMSTGPWTVAGLARALCLPAELVSGALLRLEAEGQVLRGRFTAGAGPGDDGIEFCDRRLLARIHRLTTQRLRREIDPVAPSLLLRFLGRWQHLMPGTQLSGQTGLRHVLQQLQGFEAGAGAWEEDLLRMRLSGYDPAWLDSLCLSGEISWGRLRPPAESRRGPTRAAPLSLWLRQDDGWLREPPGAGGGPGEAAPGGSALAAAVLELLDRRGALFLQDLCGAARATPEQVREALGELVSRGLVTADGFGGLRALLGQGGRTSGPAGGPGRWSRLYPPLEMDERERMERWARQYLRRYGVVLRELILRETAGPAYREVLPALRTLEARGEIRGGLFVAGLSGEQFALPEALEGLRALRRHLGDDPPPEELAVSAADPLNLAGVLFPGAKIPCTAAAPVRFRDGVPAAEPAPAAAAPSPLLLLH